MDEHDHSLTASTRSSQDACGSGGENQFPLGTSERYMHSLLRSLPDILFVLDDEGRFLDYKADSRELFARPADFLGKHLSDVLPPKIATILHNAVIRAKAGTELVRVEYQLEMPAGIRFYAGNIVPLSDGNILATIRDVTDQKRVEEELRSEMALQNLLMTMASKYINIRPEAVESAIHESLGELSRFVGADRAYIFDYDWQRDVCDNSYEWCEKGIEPQKDQLQGVPLSFIPWWVEAHRRGDSLYIPDVSALPQGDGVREILEPQSVRSLITLPVMDSGQCVGFVGFDSVLKRHSYTERERILLSMFAQILVNIRTRASLEERIIEESRKAMDASKAKSAFLASMSHEIRTPLNAIIGFSELLSRTTLDPIQRQYVENVTTSGQALLGTINDILDFSKIEAGKLELDPSKTDLVELVEESVDILKFQAGRKKLELLLSTPQDMPRFVVADSVRLRQILVNLLSNAVKFTEKGEVELKLDWEPIAPGRGRFTFSVRDTGIGMNQEQRSKLFKAFSQADASTTRKYGGTGLGLTISNLLASKMGSFIDLETEPGRGSRFHFSLELACEEGGRLEPGCLARISRVLVVDDNSANRQILGSFFADWGIEYEEAADGLGALRLLESGTGFDLVIVDYDMPWMDGLQTIAMIREKLKIGPDRLPVILLHSSSEDEKVSEGCARYSVRFNVHKPVKSRHLMSYLCSLQEDSGEKPCSTGTSSYAGAPHDSGVAPGLRDQVRLEVSGPGQGSGPTAKSGTGRVPGSDHAQGDAPNSGQGSGPRGKTLPSSSPGILSSHPAGLPETSPRILVAEDVPMNMMLIRAILKKLAPEAEIIEAVNGREAVERFRDRKPDLVFLDLQMPVLDGHEAAKEIRALESRDESREQSRGQSRGQSRVPVYALTAGALREEEKRALAAGMDGFLTKPVNTLAIKEVVEKHLKFR